MRPLKNSPTMHFDNHLVPVSRATSMWRTHPFWLAEANFPCGTTNQKHCQDLDGDASSVWNFCARFIDVALGTRVFFSRVRRRASTDSSSAEGRRHVLRSREKKISGAERLDLPCWMDLDLVANLSIKSAVASQFKSNYQGRDDALQRKESHYFQNNKLVFK